MKVKKWTEEISSDLPCGYYRHFKGDIYQVFGIVSNAENLTTYALYGKQAPRWIRVIENFTSDVLVEGNNFVPRFDFLGEEMEQTLFELKQNQNDRSYQVEESITRGYYRYFNGDKIQVFGVVKDSESLMNYVLYGKTAPKSVRAIEIFTSLVWNGSALVPRYEFLGEHWQEQLL